MEGRTAVLPAHRPCAGAASSSSRAAPSLPLLPPRRHRARRPLQPVSALQPEHLEALSSSLGHLMTLAYEPVVLPCSALNCGDIVYRRWVLGRARDLRADPGGGTQPAWPYQQRCKSRVVALLTYSTTPACPAAARLTRCYVWRSEG